MKEEWKIEEKKELDVDLRLTDVQQAAGKLYILTFYFKPFSLVESSCTLETWDAVNEDLYPENLSQSN